ncbi:MAG: hypothetical protein ABWZ25_13235 [Chitinophagaceae bacterium]
MKRILIAALVFCMGTGVVDAQEISSRKTDSVRMDKKARKPFELDLENELSLTSEQSAKWNAIRQDMNDKISKVNNDPKLDRTQRLEEIRLYRKSQEKQLQEILTPQQQEQLRELRKAKKAQRRKDKGE